MSADEVELAIALTMREAAGAGQWSLAAELAAELQARRIERSRVR